MMFASLPDKPDHDALERAVLDLWERESTFATSFPRTPTYHKVKAGLKNGRLVAMNQDICCGWMGPRFSVGKKYGSD